MWRPAAANPAVRGRKRHADALQGGPQAKGMGIGDRQAIEPSNGADCARPAARDHHACHAPARHRVRACLVVTEPETGDRNELPCGSDAPGKERMTAPIL